MLSGRLNNFARYLRLLRRHHRALIASFFVLLVVRIGLTFSSYRNVQGWTDRYARLSRRPARVPVLVWSITHTAKVIPGATCLTQALALRFLMVRAGEGCTIRIGVRETNDRPFDAHAWVIYQGRALIGGSEQELRTFKPLVDL